MATLQPLITDTRRRANSHTPERRRPLLSILCCCCWRSHPWSNACRGIFFNCPFKKGLTIDSLAAWPSGPGKPCRRHFGPLPSPSSRPWFPLLVRLHGNCLPVRSSASVGHSLFTFASILWLSSSAGCDGGSGGGDSRQFEFWHCHQIAFAIMVRLNLRLSG